MKPAQPRVKQTYSAAEDRAPNAIFGSKSATSGAKTQAGYAIVGLTKNMIRKILIHIHIPKCGGSTFREILKENHGTGYFNTNSVLNNYQYKASQILEILNHHPTCTCLSGHKLSTDLPYDHPQYQLNPITFVRDPVDRFVSHYFFHRHHVKNWVPEAKFMLLDEYIDWALVENNQIMYVNGQLRFLTGDAFEENLTLIDNLTTTNGLLLLPIEYFNDALVILNRLLPDSFASIFAERINISTKDQTLTPKQRERILELCHLDMVLHQKSNILLQTLKKNIFPDTHQYEGALQKLAKNSKRRSSFIRKLLQRSAKYLNHTATLLKSI